MESMQGDIRQGPSPASLQMLMAFSLLGYRIYEGTAPKAKVLKRRAKNKAARISRRNNRA